jgi:hypothetical protein
VRQLADLDGDDFAEIIRAEHLHLVQAADRDIGELTTRIANDVDMIGDRTRIERLVAQLRMQTVLAVRRTLCA